jgi:hypothetical protein
MFLAWKTCSPVEKLRISSRSGYTRRMECATCLELHGVGCEATHQDDAGKWVCLFCLDGEICPIRAKRIRAAKKKTPPDETPPAGGDGNSTDRASEVKSEEKMPELRENSTETAPKMCRRPGCEIKLSSANVIGLCARHVRWTAPSNGHAAASSRSAHAANGSARKTNGSNGHSSTPTNGHAAAPARSNGAAAVLADLAPDRVNALLAALPAGDKERLARAWLRGTV